MKNFLKVVIVILSRTICMQRLMDAVSNGYTHYCAGTVSISRCTNLVKKLSLNYHVFVDRNERARRKRAGLGNAKLILLFRDGYVHWWLMVTSLGEGAHAAHSIEKLRDATRIDGRIEFEGFELVRLPKKSPRKPASPTNTGKQSVKRKVTSSTTLTWRMNKHKYQAWRDSIIEGVRSTSTGALDLLIYKLWSSPGFSGIRSQIGNIAALYKNEVKRASRKDAPALPKRLGYVRRLNTKGITLEELVAQNKAQSASQHLDLRNLDDMTKVLSENSVSGMANSAAGDHVL